MTRLGWVLLVGGFLLQLLIPLNIVELSGWTFLGIPGPLAGVFFSAIAMVVGIFIVYRYWYKNHVINVGSLDRLDRSR